MFKAVVVKELRDTLGIVCIALAVYLYFITGQTGPRTIPSSGGMNGGIPFVGGFLSWQMLLSVPLAITLGLRQSVAESTRNTWLFLLHRPAERGKLIGLKLATGVVLYLVCAAAPILVFAWWAATPGTHASPFEWSMTGPSWQAWLSLTAVYFSAFLTGIRPARWFGSRLFPLVAAGVLVSLVQLLPWWWLLGLGAVLLLDAWVIVSILYVARTRDF